MAGVVGETKDQWEREVSCFISGTWILFRSELMYNIPGTDRVIAMLLAYFRVEIGGAWERGWGNVSWGLEFSHMGKKTEEEKEIRH